MNISSKEKTYRQLLHVALVAAMLMLSACASTPTAPQVSWALANEYPATSLSGEGDALFAELVSKQTHGTVSITVSPDAKLGYKSRQQVKAVAEGKVAVANSFGGALTEEDAIFGLSSLPFVATNLAEARALYEIARPQYDAAFAKHNQILLYATPWPPSGLWAKTPASSVEAVAKMSIRTYDKTGTEVFSRLGAKARVVSFSDLAPMLAAGDINAVLSSGDGGAGRKLWEHLQHFTEIGYAVPLSFTTVNLDRWKALTSSQRAEVLAAATETQAHVWRALEGRVEKNYARMRENGMTITSPIPAALREPLRAAGEAEAKKWSAQVAPECADLLRKFRAVNFNAPK